MIRTKTMKNDYQENGLLRGPLILMVPASNLVAVTSLHWLHSTNRAAVSAQRTVGTIWQIRRELRKTSRSSVEPLSSADFRGRGDERSRALDNLADMQSDHAPLAPSFSDAVFSVVYFRAVRQCDRLLLLGDSDSFAK